MKTEKIYAIEFMQYTDFGKTCVSNGAYELKDLKYLDTKQEPFLVRESDLEKYKIYGQGYRNLTFVGYMEVDNNDN